MTMLSDFFKKKAVLQVANFLNAAIDGDLKQIQLSLQNVPHIIDERDTVRLQYMLWSTYNVWDCYLCSHCWMRTQMLIGFIFDGSFLLQNCRNCYCHQMCTLWSMIWLFLVLLFQSNFSSMISVSLHHIWHYSSWYTLVKISFLL